MEVRMTRRQYGWYHKLTALLFAIFCFEMGLFLLIFPWIGNQWETNYFASISADSYRAASVAQWWRLLWISPYFRGAVSGLGVINIYIAVLEIFRLRRFTPPQAHEPGPSDSVE